jgi:hypothetical protein
MTDTSVIQLETTFSNPEIETPITELSLEKIITRREMINHILEQYEAERKVLNDEIVIRLQAEKIQGKILNDHTISIGRRFSVVMPKKKEEKEKVMVGLRALGLVETVEKVNSDLIKNAHENGVDLPCEVSETFYPIVREIVKE